MRHKKPIAKEITVPFSELSFPKKLQYIKDYYIYHIVAVIIAIIVIVCSVNAYIRNNYETACSLAIVDGTISGYKDNTDAITTGLTNYLGIDGKKERVICDYNLSLDSAEDDQDVYVSQNKIYIKASSGDIDGYIANSDYIGYFSSDRELFLYDLRELLSQEELNKISDSIVYYTKEDGTKIPYAVDLTNTKIKKDTDFSIEHPCFGVVVTAAHKDNAVAFIKYAFDLD